MDLDDVLVSSTAAREAGYRTVEVFCPGCRSTRKTYQRLRSYERAERVRDCADCLGEKHKVRIVGRGE
jgi:hypothetical protein